MTDKKKTEQKKKQRKNRISAVTRIKLINANADVLIALNGNALLKYLFLVAYQGKCLYFRN